MDREKYIFDGLERHYEEFKKCYFQISSNELIF